MQLSKGRLLQCEAASAAISQDKEALILAAARRLGEQALKDGLLDVEVRLVGGKPVARVRGVVAKP